MAAPRKGLSSRWRTSLASDAESGTFASAPAGAPPRGFGVVAFWLVAKQSKGGEAMKRVSVELAIEARLFG